jgi:hypothetical protein
LEAIGKFIEDSASTTKTLGSIGKFIEDSASTTKTLESIGKLIEDSSSTTKTLGSFLRNLLKTRHRQQNTIGSIREWLTGRTPLVP